jgi:hypothetical protein
MLDRSALTTHIDMDTAGVSLEQPYTPLLTHPQRRRTP